MRTLLLFRGAPGCGKSTFIKEHNLEQYTLSADTIRLMYSGYRWDKQGDPYVNQNCDNQVWTTLMSMLEYRMENGDFTVIDSTNSKTSDMNRLVNLAKKYKYRVYLVDMTDLPIDECKSRNAARYINKRVPEEVIDRMYARFDTQSIPKTITVLKPDEWQKIFYQPINIDKYDKVHFIGDIHGSYDALSKFILSVYNEDGIKEDVVSNCSWDPLPYYDPEELSNVILKNHLYVFLGDYLDRGMDNLKTLQFLMRISSLPNVVLLEGNHERWLSNWSHDKEFLGRNFRDTSKIALDRAIENGELKKKEVKSFCRRFGQIGYYKYGDRTILACHGGFSNPRVNPLFVSTNEFVNGSGKYEDIGLVEKTWLCLAPRHNDNGFQEEYIQVHGHRNMSDADIQEYSNCFNLEGHVETPMSGNLKVLSMTKTQGVIRRFANLVTNTEENEYINQAKVKPSKEVNIRQTGNHEFSSIITDDTPIDQVVNVVRSDRNIEEVNFGDISSFNFTRNAFDKRKWNSQTIKARGLFIDLKNNRIQCRGYEKFFNINERQETRLENLKHTLSFPIKAYVKENGFLGMISYHEETNRLVFATKRRISIGSDNQYDYVNYLKELFYESTTVKQREFIEGYLIANKQTLVVEVVDMEHDPHIIEYPESRIYALDLIDNRLEFSKADYIEELVPFCEEAGLQPKQLAFIYDTWEEFEQWYNLIIDNPDYTLNNHHIEGYVIEDSNGYMVKMKLHYYKYWKLLRTLAESMIRVGHVRNPGKMYDAFSNYFIHFIKQHREDYGELQQNGNYRLKKDFNIIKARNDYYKSLAEEQVSAE